MFDKLPNLALLLTHISMKYEYKCKSKSVYNSYIINLVSTYFVNLDSVLVIYDDPSQMTVLSDFYIDCLNAALMLKNQPNTSSESNEKHLVLHWMQVTNATNDDEYNNLMFRNVEIGLQVRHIVENPTTKNHLKQNVFYLGIHNRCSKAGAISAHQKRGAANFGATHSGQDFSISLRFVWPSLDEAPCVWLYLHTFLNYWCDLTYILVLFG